VTKYVAFSPPHLLKEYLGKPGHEIEGLALPPAGLQALADSRVLGHETLVVQGRWDHDDGRFYLDLAVPTGHIEAVTNYRHDGGRLRLICQDCGMKDGKHKRGCAA
jgi:hypothetical protein